MPRDTAAKPPWNSQLMLMTVWSEQVCPPKAPQITLTEMTKLGVATSLWSVSDPKWKRIWSRCQIFPWTWDWVLDSAPVHLIPWILPQKDAQECCLWDGLGEASRRFSWHPNIFLTAGHHVWNSTIKLLDFTFFLFNAEEALEIICVCQGLTRKVEATFRLFKAAR